MKTITIDECIKMIRAALKQGFPNTKFSVRKTRSTYSHNIDVSWTDGPTSKQVKPILDRFKSEGFDGMTDCSYSCGKRILCGQEVEVSGNYVSGNRSVTREYREAVVNKLAAECGLSGITLDMYGNVDGAPYGKVPYQWHMNWKDDGFSFREFLDTKHVLASDSHEGEYFPTLVWRLESCISFEEQKPIAPELLPEYIDVNATVSTGRASFEEPQKMFAGHAALEQESFYSLEDSPLPQKTNPVPELKSFAQECTEYLAEQKKTPEEKVDQEINEALTKALANFAAEKEVFNCSVGKQYTREEYKQRTSSTPNKVVAITDRIQ